jgi:hypothetical protein
MRTGAREIVHKAARLVDEVGPRPGLLVAEIAARTGRGLRRRRLRRGYERLVASPPGGASLRVPAVDLPAAGELPGALRDAAARLRGDADDALAHSFEVLGWGRVELGPDIEWHEDFTCGGRWPADFYQDVAVVRPGDLSDPKAPWELSRCHHLLPLARAARLFEEERYAEAIERDLAAWLDANPPGAGINWACPMEVAIRSINWIFALAALEPVRALGEPVRTRVVRSLQVHGRHIAANLEGTPVLRGNHYLADVTGLFVLGCVLDRDPDARRWRKAGLAALERQARSQVLPDGVGFEGSLPYHGLALELLLVARAVGRDAGQRFSSTFDDRLRAMLAASAALRHPDGRIPQTGDSDSGRVLPGGPGREPTHDNLLWLGAAILGERHVDGEPDPEVAWTLGLDAWRRAASAPPAHRPPTAFPAGGLYVLRGGGTHCVVRCGGVGQNGRGGHAHNDLLSFELSVQGEPVVVDPGTYAYTSCLAARDLFRSTAFHSTVRLDGEEQRPIPWGEPFRLPEATRRRVERADLDGPVAVLTCSHDGYRRLHPGAVHRRTFSLERESGTLEIADELLGDGTRLVESFLRLAPGASVRRVGDALVVEQGSVRLALRIEGADEVELVEGWVSERFGEADPAPAVVARAVRRLPCGLRLSLVPLGVRRPAAAAPAPAGVAS